LGSRLVWSQTAFFSVKPVSKNAGKSTIGLWIVACEYRIPTFRNPNHVRQPMGRKDSIQTVILTSRRLDLILYEAAQNFEVFSNIQK
jgi:hypothetical protein